MFTKADSPLGRSLHDFARAIDKAAATGEAPQLAARAR
jgi:hypothetical protein